jgi:uncharacterized membrane protein (DUF485 family)
MAPDTERDRVSARAAADERRRRVRRTTRAVSLIALAFYLGFIILKVMRARR